MSPYSFERFPGEPILLFTFTGKIDHTTILQAFLDGNPLIEAVAADGFTRIYSLLDMRGTEVTFADVIQIVRRTKEFFWEGQAVSNFQPFIIGTGAMLKLYVEIIRQENNFGLQIPMTTTIEDALAAARKMIVEAARTDA
ncbi:MAG: hypothetical protein SF162_11645 [bacterium]|nr:hypothetical protein [bacterium]